MLSVHSTHVSMREKSLDYHAQTHSLSITLGYKVSLRENFRQALILPMMPHRVAQKCNFVILRIKLDVKRKQTLQATC